MIASSSELLEFGELKELLGRYVTSPLGRRVLENVAPCCDRETLAEVLAETAEAIEYLKAAQRPQSAARGAAVRLRFDAFTDPTEALAKLRIEGASLEAAEIWELVSMLDSASEIRRLLMAAGERFPSLARRARRLGEFGSIVGRLTGKILPGGILADDASPELARLRRELERQRRAIQESLEKFLRRHRQDDLLQEEFVTIRNDRFVVPVIAGRQGRIEGVVHGASASGHTLFVEPLETIELNNELVRLAEEEMREVHRILLEMTAYLRSALPEIQATLTELGELEWLFAKARFALDFDCAIPAFSPPGERRLALQSARHPLLEDVLRRQHRKIVPISLELDDNCRTLLISGPNTGGKTVTIKTVGLIALMAQSGIPVPAERAELPLFSKVLADIGDNQSIQESLSTFSAHIARVRDMLVAADSNSLVLLDELGRATDPEEGGALGVAVLERFGRAGAFTLASTHLLALKIYGATTPGVLNASMGFDERTLEPTFVLELGRPGKSAGLEIARRLGMPAELIAEAQARLSEAGRDVSRFISELDRRLEETSELAEQLRRQKESLARTEELLARRWAEKEESRLRELERRVEQLIQQFDAQARETLEKIAAELGSRKTAASVARQTGRLKREFRAELKAVFEAATEKPPPAAVRLQLEPGARVRLRDLREPARVRRLLGDGKVEVEAGFLRLQISEEEILEVLSAVPVAPKAGVALDRAPYSARDICELNVIGQHVEEARAQVEKFLDNAILADVERVRIVHGHGMGILRRAISELLAAHPHVEKFYPAEQNEGGAGATIVELKG